MIAFSFGFVVIAILCVMGGYQWGSWVRVGRMSQELAEARRKNRILRDWCADARTLLGEYHRAAPYGSGQKAGELLREPWAS